MHITKQNIFARNEPRGRHFFELQPPKNSPPSPTTSVAGIGELNFAGARTKIAAGQTAEAFPLVDSFSGEKN